MFGFSEIILNEICASLKKTKENQFQEAERYKKEALELKEKAENMKKQLASQTINDNTIVQNNSSMDEITQNQIKLIETKAELLLQLSKMLTNYSDEVENKRKSFVEAGEKSKKVIVETQNILSTQSSLISKTTSIITGINLKISNTGATGITDVSSTSSAGKAVWEFIKSVSKSSFEYLKETGASTTKNFFSGVTSLIMGQDPKAVLVKVGINQLIDNFKTGAKFSNNVISALVKFGKDINISEIVKNVVKKTGEVITGAKEVVGKVTKSIISNTVEVAKMAYKGVKEFVTGAKKVASAVTKTIIKGSEILGDMIIKSADMTTNVLNSAGKFVSGANTVIGVASNIATVAAVVTGATPAGPVVSMIATGLKTASTALSVSSKIITGAAQVSSCKSTIAKVIKERIQSDEKITINTILKDSATVVSAVGKAAVGTISAAVGIKQLSGVTDQLVGVTKNIGDVVMPGIKEAGNKLVTGAKKAAGFVSSIFFKK